MLNTLISLSTLKKLVITGHANKDCDDSPHSTFEAQVNPESISLSHSISHTQKKKVGDEQDPTVTNSENAQELSFSIILDDTGVLAPMGGAAMGMATSAINALGGGDASQCFIDQKIEELKETCYYFRGDEHAHTYCKISWDKDLLSYKGTSFGGRLKSMNITYTLFSPSGSPLRAKVDLGFIGVITEETLTKVLGKSSPDLTHVITIKSGDNLPSLCKNIYGDASLYTEIAKINNIVNFRYIKPGTELTFPPMK